jgi:asparagine synthase (glutamine-hydrolysing)
LASADQTAWITHNGEVYNFAEIRQELGALGYPFRSRSDTEFIVNGWRAGGTKIFSRLRGMFARAIWDRGSQRLVLARDQVGKKPLYFAPNCRGFLFGSEIKPLLAWSGVRRAPDLLAIDRYVTLGYVPALMPSQARLPVVTLWKSLDRRSRPASISTGRMVLSSLPSARSC